MSCSQAALVIAMPSSTDERLSFAKVRAARDRHDREPQERELPSRRSNDSAALGAIASPSTRNARSVGRASKRGGHGPL